jgi:diguanylate cyclase (GGDEF)-like protein
MDDQIFADPAAEVEMDPPTVMVVDDDAAILDVICQSLAQEGITCEGFRRAEEALESLQQRPVAVLLTDIVMPGMGGLELLNRAKQVHPALTVIMMTGFVREFSYDEALRAGAADFIKKPFTTQELLARLKYARLKEHLRALSITDELTGLANRRGFFAFAQQQIKQQRRSKGSLVLLFADLDNFKSINDTLGHQAGDQVLIGAARILRETYRDSDIVARMGGDEFAAILVNSPETSIAAMRGRLQERIDAYNARQGGRITLSMSAGMAVVDPSRPATVDELVREADARMYEEKQRKKADASGRAK